MAQLIDMNNYSQQFSLLVKWFNLMANREATKTVLAPAIKTLQAMAAAKA